jgi:PAS domain S-box-containing protein
MTQSKARSAKAGFVEQRYYELTRFISDAVFALTPRGIVTSMNEAFSSMSGWNQEDWIGKHFKHFISTSDFKRVTLSFKRTLLYGISESIPVKIKCKKSENMDGELTLIPIFHGKKVLEILGVIQYAASKNSPPHGVTHGSYENALKAFLSQVEGLFYTHKILLPVVDGLLYVNCGEILFCEASGNYTKIHSQDGKKYLVSKSLQEYEKILANHNFFRIHNSYLVNLMAIKKYVRGGGGYVILQNGIELTVSKRKRSGFLARLGVKANYAEKAANLMKD